MSGAPIYLIRCIPDRARLRDALGFDDLQLPPKLGLIYRSTSFLTVPYSHKGLRMVPAVKLRVFNIVVKTPSGNFRVLQALEDYPNINMNLDPKDNKELPPRINLFYNDTCNVRVWQEIMVDHILSDILIGVQTPN